MSSGMHRLRILVGLIVVFASLSRIASAELYINEIFFNPGGQANDQNDEYIELRGPAEMPLTDYYLILLENELDEVGAGVAGSIENIFDLGSYSLGTNGFITIRQNGSRYPGIAAGTTDLVNMGTGSGFGSGATSSIGASDDHSAGEMSNSGATMMLIRNHGGLTPTLGFDLDQGNDGLDTREGSAQTPLDDWHEKWDIVDSVGFFAEPTHTEFGRLYGKVNFGSFDPNFPFGPSWEPNIEPDAEFELEPYEIEYLARWGNSTGQTVDDWHVTNLTDSLGSGYIFNTFLLRQSGDPHPQNDLNPNTPAPQPAFVETNKDVPYGTILTGSLGSPNFMLGDFNKDGVVDAADYTVWRDTLGQTGSEFDPEQSPLVPNHPKADGTHDFLVDEADYAVWKNHFGEPGLGGGEGAIGGSATVPEPATWLLIATAIGLPVAATRGSRLPAAACLGACT